MSKSLSLEVVSSISQSEIVRLQISLIEHPVGVAWYDIFLIREKAALRAGLITAKIIQSELSWK